MTLRRLSFCICLALLLPACAARSKRVPALEDAGQEIQKGNERFVHDESIHPRQTRDERQKLATGQEPHTIVLSCSDSRVPPEIVLDQGLGDLFVVRSAGEVPDSAGIASIEYALEHLGAKNILVLGHERCGAVKAAMETPKGKSAGSPDLDRLIDSIRPAVAPYLGAKRDASLRDPVRAQAEAVAKELPKKSKIVSEKVASGEVKISKGIYHLETGEVETW